MSRRTSVADALLFATVFTITLANVRWVVGGLDVNLSDIAASLFVLVFLAARMERRDWGLPRTGLVLAAFFAAFALVYLVGFYNLETNTDRDQFVKGFAKFVVHFAFLIAAVAHLARRSEWFYWRTLAWFVAGIAANAAYGLLELAVAETTGANLDQAVLSPIGSYQRGGINIYGEVAGASIYRVNALTLDPNHLAIMLVVPLVVLLPLYLRLPRRHRLRTPLAVLLAFLLIAELATLSRSGLLGLGAALLVLALPYRRHWISPRFLVPLGAVGALLAVVVLRRLDFFETVLRVRSNLSGGSIQVHLGFYELLPPVLDQHPLFGLGLNTFSTYYEFLTGETNWGPHSYYVAVLTETGIVGAVLFVAYLVFLFRRIGALRALGRALARSGDAAAARVRPLGYGLSAALVGTLAANAFYLTMQMYYFFVFAMLAVAAPAVFAKRARDYLA